MRLGLRASAYAFRVVDLGLRAMRLGLRVSGFGPWGAGLGAYGLRPDLPVVGDDSTMQLRRRNTHGISSTLLHLVVYGLGFMVGGLGFVV